MFRLLPLRGLRAGNASRGTGIAAAVFPEQRNPEFPVADSDSQEPGEIAATDFSAPVAFRETYDAAAHDFTQCAPGFELQVGAWFIAVAELQNESFRGGQFQCAHSNPFQHGDNRTVAPGQGRGL